ncbi:antibiotic ABC transporter substrate-binding protein [Kocuria varians]|uniref:Antibiotic ABC transporter substrate-binding protein n=1 Tax=Kocuria varians TaxID=1272 RepID=A0A4Y4D2L3_KOCVA|nr:Fe2+-enterobactin ABC transporter substrate-binding protein [Kocuria varians]GEC98189.1 antibiotic ABC transporter substrate-binding protein [Kocuria varians]
MTSQTSTLRRLFAALVVGLVAVFALTACGGGSKDSSSDSSASASASSSDETWPKTVKDDNDKEVKLEAKPEKIVSTSVTLTGSLLAIDAPVIASGGTSANTSISDDKGFFTQWSDQAKEKNVKSLYTGDPSAEKILAEKPDLIIVSKSGADSAMDVYDQLKDTDVPVYVMDYSDKDWQEVAQTLGDITGNKQKADDVVKTFDERVNEVKDNIKQPEQPVTGMVYNAGSFKDDSGANIWTSDSAQGKLLEQLGFKLADVPGDAVDTNSQMGKRSDIKPITGENLSKAATGKTVFLFASDDKGVDTYLKDSLVANTEAVKNKAVYALGQDSFRLDYYSSNNVLDKIESQLKK